MLDHERLDAYQCALRFTALAYSTIEGLPAGHAQLADQLRRAAISVPLNIAEGAGKTSGKERARSHAIARGSAMECAAAMDVFHVQGLTSAERHAEAKALLFRLISMLSKMSRQTS